MRFVILVLVVSMLPAIAQAKSKKKVKYRKTQEVSFDGSDVDGTARTPDGSYLHQKRGIDFVPLYKVKKRFGREIAESVEYLRWEN